MEYLSHNLYLIFFFQRIQRITNWIEVRPSVNWFNSDLHYKQIHSCLTYINLTIPVILVDISES